MVYVPSAPYHEIPSKPGSRQNSRPPHQSGAPDVDVIASTSRSLATHPARAKCASNDAVATLAASVVVPILSRASTG